MVMRCTNPRYRKYRIYGARGISVCDRWRNSFKAFLEDMGERPEGKTLDRWPDRDGNYEPGNCRWATSTEQARNTSRTIMVEWEGKQRALIDIADDLGLNRQNLRRWIKIGVPLERAIENCRVVT
jgi:hypothetical protein